MTRTILLMVAALLSLVTTSSAQSCYPVNFSIDSYIAQGGPAFSSWALYTDEEVQINQGMAQFSLEDPFYDETLCLVPGCYGMVLTLGSAPANPESFVVNMTLNGESIELLNYSSLMNIVAFQFCLPEFDCPTTIIAEANDCDSYLFYIPGAPGAEVDWSFGDGTGENWGVEVDHSYTQNGTFTVIALLDGPACPGPFTLMTQVTVECAEPVSCPEAIFVGETDICGTFNFEIGSAAEGEFVIWSWGDGSFTEGGHFAQHHYEAAGDYTVSAFYTSNDCPDGVELTTVVQVPPCEQNCPTVVETIQVDCNTWNFTIAGGWENETNTAWYVDGSVMASYIGQVFTFNAEDNETHIIVAQYAGQPCGQVFITAEPVQANCQPECPNTLEIGNPSCGVYVLNMAGAWPQEWNTTWLIDNVYAGQGTSFEFVPEAQGCYTIQAVYLFAEGCNVTLTETICFEGCDEDPCPTEIWHSENDCGFFQFEAGSFQPGENVTWYFGDEVIQGAGHYIEHQFDFEGEIQVCCFFTSELCPEGVELCTVVNSQLCNTECYLELTAVELGNGEFEFTANGNPEVLPMFWNFGDGTTLNATWVTQHVFEPGTYEVCATIESEECPEPVTACITVVVENPSCTEVSFAMDSFTEFGGTPFLEWTLMGNGAVAASGMAQYGNNDPWYEQTLCLEDGCYVLMACGNTPLTEENFNLWLSEAWELISFTLVDNKECTGFEALISLNGDCGTTGDCEASFEVFFTQQPGHLEFGNTGVYGPDAQFIWSYGDGQISDGENGNVWYNSNGTYQVCLTVIDGDCTDTWCQDVVVEDMDPGCTANIVFLEFSAQYDSGGLADLIELTLAAEGIEFDSFEIPISSGVSYTGILCLPDGCYSAELNFPAPMVAELLNLEIQVNNEVVESWQLEQGVTSGNFTFGVNIDCGDDVPEMSSQTWTLYPNPANDLVYIEVAGGGTALVELMDASGRLVNRITMTDSRMGIPTSGLMSGLYFVRLTSGGTSTVQRLEIMR